MKSFYIKFREITVMMDVMEDNVSHALLNLFHPSENEFIEKKVEKNVCSYSENSNVRGKNRKNSYQFSCP